MSGFSQYRMLGVLVEEFSEFLQRLFEGKEDKETSTRKIKETLSQLDLTIADIAKKPISTIKVKLEKIDSEILDLIVVFLYQTSQNDNEAQDKHSLTELKSLKNLNFQIMELIKYLDLERKTFSLERSNIKNSLQHLP
ncbi:hypothetical protein B4Q04_21800 [Zobellia sp. OII3]|uniref:hypothetical protein n=1 Tax=Zobellia sp. OII3 TaxID=2034520 RepID=UPI000B532E53|nr:hypothetical protein [Zobellia sp. OII3]OWW23194.1 hypothetical protein B4Q04_21800 [Zobellia sp. OII3]